VIRIIRADNAALKGDAVVNENLCKGKREKEGERIAAEAGYGITR
jgi:hypothetical protein